MSDYESHRGKIYQIDTDLSCEEFARECYTTTYNKELPSYCKTYIEALQDESEEFYFYNDKVYQIVNKELDPDRDEFYFQPLADGTVEYIFRFYNGDTCLSEQVQEVLMSLESKEGNK